MGFSLSKHGNLLGCAEAEWRGEVGQNSSFTGQECLELSCTGMKLLIASVIISKCWFISRLLIATEYAKNTFPFKM